MTHLHRIFIQKTSVFVSFTKTFPVSSTKFVSFCNSSVRGINLCEKSTNSNGDEIKSKKQKYSLQEYKEFLKNRTEESKNEIEQWKKMQQKPKDLTEISSITGIVIKPCCWGWVLFDLKCKRILEFGGQTFTPLSRENATKVIFDDLAFNLKFDIPFSDLYIVENCSYTRKRELSCMEMVLLSKLIVLLNLRHNCPRNNIIMQNISVLNNSFRLRIKSERISAFQKILRIIDETKADYVNREIIIDILSLNNIKFKKKFVEYIKNSHSPVKESVSLAFLLVLSYLDTDVSKRRQLNNNYLFDY